IASSSKRPSFYIEHDSILLMSKKVYNSNAEVLKCRGMVAKQLVNNIGHGMKHAEKVTIDIGALVCIEGEIQSLRSDLIKEAVVIAQLSGLLHDIKRREPNHAEASAREAKIKLRDFSLEEGEKEIIVQAILNHEAFVEPKKILTHIGQIISDSLYDADKFRWGIENFTETLWYMADFRGTPIALITKHFLSGLKGIRKIKDTFRTDTGKKYGPEFIDLGLEAGEKIYDYLLNHSG
ncbi:MAG: hypothetical protein Q8O44_05235, partial [Syntrophales bacterium]|nr:hypothetical protein [Syntrophales bacterium]